MPYLFELPTTGAVSFNELFVDESAAYVGRLSDATSARANVRGLLKETKRAGDDREYLQVVKVLDDYLPHLYAIMRCSQTEALTMPSEPCNWRSTLSDHLINSSPRLNFPGLLAELHFTLLTYGFALSNFAASIVSSLGAYEYQRYSSDAERKESDEKLNSAVMLLCRASGVFQHLSEKVLPSLLHPSSSSRSTSPLPRAPELSKELLSALAKLTIGDAQALAIRKLLAKSNHYTTLSIGPPLPKGHPSPGLIAKLYLFLVETYTSALTLAKIPGSKSSTGSDRSSGGNVGIGEVAADLRRYLSEEVSLSTALAHKWLGIEAGEAGRCGEAIAYLTWVKEELEAAKEIRLKSLVSLQQKDKRARSMLSERKDRITDEIKLVKSFLDDYTKQNNAVTFQPVPTRKTLQGSISTGRAAVASKAFVPPDPAFLPSISDDAASSGLQGNVDSDPDKYAGAGSYF